MMMLLGDFLLFGEFVVWGVCSYYPDYNIWMFQIFMDVSENSGFSPQFIDFNRVFHYKVYPCWGIPLFLETPICSFWRVINEKQMGG